MVSRRNRPFSHWLLVSLLGVSVFYAGTLSTAQDVGASNLASPLTTVELQQAAATNLNIMDQRIAGGQVVLPASGVATWTFPYAFETPPVVSYMAQGDGGLYPVQCNFTSVTTTTATVKCYKGAAVSVAVLGVALNAFQGAVTGTVVHIHARPPTQ